LIEVKAAGVCGSDVLYADGLLQSVLKPPVVLGHEFSGIIVKKGKNITKWEIGDRVVSDNTGYVCGECYACNTSEFLMCPHRLGLGYSMDGGFAKYVKILGHTLSVFPGSLMKIPDGMSFEEAAILDPACNGYKAVVQEAKLIPGENIAIFGIGPLGQNCIKAAKVAGAAKIIAICRRKNQQRINIAKQNGATHVIVTDEQDSVNAVLELTNKEGVDVTCDCAGSPNVNTQSVKITKTGGRVIKVGYDNACFNENIDMFVHKAIMLKGHFGYNWISWKNVINLYTENKWALSDLITHKLPLSEFATALELMRSKKAMKIILYPENC
jgi:threonine dehydrogenase-like Zn-dependent dehydrogenase